jgi:hypothetical protein
MTKLESNCKCTSILQPPPHFNLTQLPILRPELLIKLNYKKDKSEIKLNLNCFNTKLNENATFVADTDQLSSLSINIILTNSIFIIIVIAILVILLIVLSYLLVKIYFTRKLNILKYISCSCCCCGTSSSNSLTNSTITAKTDTLPNTLKFQQPQKFLKNPQISFIDTNCNLILIPSSGTSSTSPLSNQTTLTSGGSSFVTETNFTNQQQQQHFYESIQDLTTDYYFDCEITNQIQPVNKLSSSNISYNKQFSLSSLNQGVYIKSHIV